ncbi:glycosyltransferase [Bremerella sp. JC770]|uniref:glycosyltransferase family 2 protein n=1 Tax=Bremerella sp. JC770 TaxID=3232137 RepID=UPI00345B2DFC
MTQPSVSILLPIFNGAKHLQAAIESILRQTHADFELILIDDASTDSTLDVIQSFTDPRIVVLKQLRNHGMAAALNLGIDVAQGEFLARMDADDLALPQRLEKQIEFMQAHPEVGVCGTQMRHFGELRGVYRKPLAHDMIMAMMLIEPVMRHPTVMLRRCLLARFDFRYDAFFEVAQDYDLWTRMIQKTRFANLPEVLLQYRCEGQNNSFVKHTLRDQATYRIRKRFVESILEREATDDEASFHHRFANGHATDRESLENAEDWITTLRRANQMSRRCDAIQLKRVLAYLWCMNAAGKQIAWRMFQPLTRPDFCATAIRGYLPQIFSGIVNTVR